MEQEYGIPTVAMTTARFAAYMVQDIRSHGMPLRLSFPPYPVVGMPDEILRQYIEGEDPVTGVPLMEEIRSYLEWMRDHKFWDEDIAIANVRQILDRYLGPPPATFAYAGRTYTPVEFLRERLQLNPDDYVNVISTMKEPFGQFVLLDVQDNWRRREDYLNLPLADFYRIIKEGVKDGYPISLGGDVSEPGLDGMEDAAVVPGWDIPAKYIDQGSREFRIYNGTTSDDHGVHAVGYKRHKGRDWFLIKDSNRSSRLGQYKGYYFYEGDYIKLKMLAFMVHKDRLQGYLP